MLALGYSQAQKRFLKIISLQQDYQDSLQGYCFHVSCLVPSCNCLEDFLYPHSSEFLLLLLFLFVSKHHSYFFSFLTPQEINVRLGSLLALKCHVPWKQTLLTQSLSAAVS